jgi:hypothetical protein
LYPSFEEEGVMAFTYRDLHKELVEEAQLLLKMALETAGKPMGDPVDTTFIDKLRGEYHANPPQDTLSAVRGRARISCG